MMNPKRSNGSPVFAEIAGIKPFHYNSSEAALDALPNVAPQLVIADLKTETTDGFDILRECKENHPHTVVVMIAAFRLCRTGTEGNAIWGF